MMLRGASSSGLGDRMKTSSVLLAQCFNSLAALGMKYIQNRKHRGFDYRAAYLGELAYSDVQLVRRIVPILCIQIRCRHTRTRCCGRPSWPTNNIAIDFVLCLLRHTAARRLEFLRRLDT
jgi:hypothetical protein